METRRLQEVSGQVGPVLLQIVPQICFIQRVRQGDKRQMSSCIKASKTFVTKINSFFFKKLRHSGKKV